MKPALIVLIGAVGAAALIASTFAGSSQPSAAGRGQELVEGPVAGPVAEPDGRSAEGASPEGRPADPSGSQPGAPSGPPPTLSGTVQEVLQVPGYTYLAVASEGATRWAAVKTTDLAVGSPVEVRIDTVLQNFRSETLGRTFDSIVFGNLPSGSLAAAPAPGDATGAQANGSAPNGSDTPGSAAVDPRDVPPAEGGHRIADLFAARASLAGTTVRVRGVVTKSLPGILNRTFVRLEDGSGVREARTHELTVTTTEVPTVGARILVEGTVVVDRDFGSGYTYDLLLEDARILE